ncbi:ABC transporter ATP-binding protein [Reichenbachiella agariperforans]|uniref:ABC transporter ATP-binding protein n=1 Tax=Reichenbachiella agariperforans TaxID=156994 RepID=UPI001C08F3A0|nr:ABC transporter ATP-binding protein [Reichenbachiella agariperforans]MBU2915829.1 ABC transporter ATP-binding protein [Reichenbachiella agariperforans]
MSQILEVHKLSKTYQSGEKNLTVLDQISFSLEAGKSLAIVGPSGSGKTTLLGLCAGLDRIDTGSVSIAGHALDQLSEDQKAQVRNENVGFVFQNFQLIPTLTALENVMIPLELLGDKNAFQEATALLDQVGLADRKNHYPSQLSGGEQQRVALARAFSNRPKILFADEPTGNLDEETGAKIEKLLFDLNRDKGTALVLVTHDIELAHKTDHLIRLKGGKVFESDLLSQTHAQS